MEKEIQRLIELLNNTDPFSEEYARILGRMGTVIGLAEDIQILSFRQQEHDRSIGVVYNPDSRPSSPDEDQAEASCTPAPEASSGPNPDVTAQELVAALDAQDSPFPEETAPAEPEPELTKEYVREALRKASADKGIQIADIIPQFVPEGKPPRFSSIPPKKYPELMEALRNAAN